MRFASPFPTTQEDTRKVKTQTTAQTVEVRADAEGIVSHAGAHLLAELVDRLGLTAGLSEAMAPTRKRRSAHDPGVVLRDLIVAIADGGDCVTDLGVLRDQEALFGAVASERTAHRAIKSVDADLLEAIRGGRAIAREHAWDAGARPETITLSVDATLLGAASEKQGAAGNYKGGFGFHPLLCYLDETGEPLAGILRPGNAGSNTAADHFEVLQLALEQLPATDLDREILVRTDIGGRTHAFTRDCREAGIRFSVGYEVGERVREAILKTPQSAWQAAVDGKGEVREGASVTELTDDLDLSAWPEGTRLIVRRERPHPGAQFQVFDAEGYRHTAFITDQEGTDIAALELRHRRRAKVEDEIRCGKDTGMRNLPFAAFEHNRVWLELSLIAQELLAWTRLLCLEGELALAEPKRLRQRLLHVAGKVVRSARRTTLRLPRSWPWAEALVSAFARLRALPAWASP